jgi:RimJ/RimL family protein N-acetyltransferase
LSLVRTTIRDANVDDIDYMMSVERLPNYAERVGAWTHDEHVAKMGDPSYHCIIGLHENMPAGFVVFKDIGNEMGNLCLHRIAVGPAGLGVGTSFIANLCDWAFAETSVFRLWLDVLPSNPAARHVYGKVGFVEEGLMRSALRYPDGRRADLLLMSLLRPDWDVRKRRDEGSA